MEEDIRKELLEQYLGEEVQEGYRENVYEVIDEREEYIVLTYDEAYDEASNEIQMIFDELGLESFTANFQDWILNHALDESYFEDIVREEIEYKYDDMDDEDIVNEAIDRGFIEAEDAFESEDEEDAWSDTIIKDDVDVDNLRDQLIDDDFGDIDNYAEYVNNMFGQEYLFKLIKNNPEIIDMDTVIEECIDQDGIAHFIAHYDGNEIDLGKDYYAYRIN